MNVTIIVAIVALVSTIIGATIGAATTYMLSVRRERADKERDDRNHAVEVKRAARLIGLDLLWARTAANYWVEEKTWSHPDVPILSLSTEARQKYLDTIATDLSEDAWNSVTTALQSADSIRVILGRPRDQAIAIPDDVAEAFVPLITRIDKGCRDLGLYHFDLQAAGKSTQ
ncbi:MAG TPA: hypothetical protein VHE58_10330 [Burkholderiales bacterium]|nr:hypothetical protein [Burkholderiales bacterium]